MVLGQGLSGRQVKDGIQNSLVAGLAPTRLPGAQEVKVARAQSVCCFRCCHPA